MANQYGPRIVTDDLVLCLDAADKNSYRGSGETTWYDMSGNGYNFTVNSSAYSTSGGIPFMNFEGSYGIAKRIVGGSLSDVPAFVNATFIVFSSILNSTANWRTLIRGANFDHQVIIESGQNNLGMYDNDSNSFITANFDITNITNAYTKFNFLCWKLSSNSPYYQFQYNNNSTIYSITNVNATFNSGFASIGGYHNGSTTITDSSQYWGKITSVLYYKRQLSTLEINQNFNALRRRFEI